MFKYKTALIVLIAILLFSIGLFGFYYKQSTKKQETLEQELKQVRETIEENNVINTDLKNLEKNIQEFTTEVGILKEENARINNKGDACMEFVGAYQRFYEKADEMFANGISGCAAKYVVAGNPTKLPEGCFRWLSFKVKHGYDSNSRWQQDPDQAYYNSLSQLYYTAMAAKETCEQL